MNFSQKFCKEKQCRWLENYPNAHLIINPDPPVANRKEVICGDSGGGTYCLYTGSCSDLQILMLKRKLMANGKTL